MNRLIFAVACTAFLAACSNENGSVVPQPESTSPPAAANPPSGPITDDEARSKIDESAFETYTKKNYPKFAARVGGAMARVNDVQHDAALIAAKSSSCDRVILVTASETSTPKDLVYFIDCENGSRIFVSESDIKNKVNAVSQTEKAIDQSTALDGCRAAARNVTTYPTLADMNTWRGSSYRVAPVTGNVEVLVHFKATNAFGLESPYTARCIYPAGVKTPELTVIADS